MPIPGTPGSPVRITVFPEWPEAILVLMDEDAEGVLVLPPLPVPFDRAGILGAAREAGFLARVSEGTPGRWKPVMDKAAKDARAERTQRHRQSEATFATLARGAADPDMRERGGVIQRKQRVDEALVAAKAKLGAAKGAARTSGAYMEPTAFRTLEDEVRRLGLESQAPPGAPRRAAASREGEEPRGVARRK